MLSFDALSWYKTRGWLDVENLTDRLHIISEIYELAEAGAKLKAEDPDCGTGIVSCQKPATSYMHKKQATNEDISKEEFCTWVYKDTWNC